MAWMESPDPFATTLDTVLNRLNGVETNILNAIRDSDVREHLGTARENAAKALVSLELWYKLPPEYRGSLDHLDDHQNAFRYSLDAVVAFQRDLEGILLNPDSISIADAANMVYGMMIRVRVLKADAEVFPESYAVNKAEVEGYRSYMNNAFPNLYEIQQTLFNSIRIIYMPPSPPEPDPGAGPRPLPDPDYEPPAPWILMAFGQNCGQSDTAHREVLEKRCEEMKRDFHPISDLDEIVRSWESF
jgi:hypothetical protein